ncbi:hypothetical protein [Geothrix sp. 21YS21S-2]|uniref:hypothetical protein n=1 Tax=Geothrix sp. 21YS21S-2 TaxID=3068893 RepID=UPI0027B98020|nr:hypothetical protein [Geothrix sp. 21YS21S-2]
MALSFALAMTRVYQVDEAQTVYMATVLAKGWTGSLFTSGQLHLHPLSLLAHIGSTSATTFLVFRACFWALFWVNAALAVRASGMRVRSLHGAKGLVLAGTLATWWAYALECRHDNILITGLLVLWILARRTRLPRDLVFLSLGFVSLLLHACLFKSIAVWAPLTALLVGLEPGGWATRARRAGWWLLGAAGCYLACWAFKAHAGIQSLGANGQNALRVAVSSERFAPWHTLQMLLGTSPLLVAAMGGLVLLGAAQLRRRGLRKAWEEEAGFPEVLLFVLCAFAFLANPTPFPYNLATLSAGALVAILALGRPWLEPGAFREARGLPFLVSLGLLLHLTPWAMRVAELFSMPNDRQEEIMAMTEAFTGPDDPVYDGIGMVPTRKAPTYEWVINWANQGQFHERPLFANLGDRVPPVVLPSYRLNYLPPADRAFLAANYLLLHKDFWVLGASPRTSAEPGTWTCLRSGRYALIPLKPDPGPVTLDGQIIPQGITWIAKGTHQLAMDPASPSALSWVGPTVQRVPVPGNDGAPSLCPVPGGF